ncbi:MAG: methionyl-tRNA formyltransferase [Steroidobacteraceae bacterium]|jgi:methionyl-tRNA formyltransferase
MLRVAFAGTPEFAVPALRALARSDHQLVGVLSQPDRPAGRGRELKSSPIKQLALELGLPLAQPARLRSEAERAPLEAWASDVLVVVAYGLILPPTVLALPRLGCLNIHASLLPRWRGAAPIQRAILAGDAETGVTIMQLDAELDTGATLAQRRVAIEATSDSGQLQAVLATLGAQLLLETLDALEAGRASATPQPRSGVTYAAKIDKAEAQIDWHQSAEQISRQVRAFNPWPVADTRWQGRQVRIWEAVGLQASADNESGSAPGAVLGLVDGLLRVQCGQGALAIRRLQLAGRRVVDAAQFAAGAMLPGAHFD